MKNIMKLKLLAAAVLMVAGTAHASSTFQGTLIFADDALLFGKTGLSGPFDLYWDFALAGDSSATSSVTSHVNGFKDVDFTGVYLTNAAHTITWNYTQTGFDPNEQWSLASTTLLLTDNNWEIHTIGSAVNKAAFAGELQVTAVPEPETYAMFLAGLGLMGFMARRRSKAS